MAIDSPEIMSVSSDAPTEAEKAEVVAESSPAEEAAEANEQEADAEDTAEDSGAEPKKKSKVQERIDELTAKRREAEREAQYWREQAEKSIKPEKANVDVEPVKPKFDDFSDIDEYEAAVEKYASDKAAYQESQVIKRQTELQKQFEEQQRAATFAAKSAEFAAGHPDFYATVQNPSLTISTEMAEAIRASDRGPELAYHLGKNPELAAQIAGLPASTQYMTLGRLEATLTAPAPTPVALTKAPPPVKPIGSKAVVEKDPEGMSYADYRAWRNKQK
jgi:hypothetical protein